MQVLIDNLDGLGSLDNTAWVQFDKSATIVRQLNQPTICTFSFVVCPNGAAVPATQARVQILDATGTVLFTGYVAAQPVMNVDGAGEQEALFVATVVAISDELLLDADVSTTQTTLLGQSAQQDWAALAALSSSSSLPLALSEQLSGSSRVEVETGARWSETAGMLANNTRSTYRSVAGGVEVTSIGEVTHAIAASDPGLHFNAVNLSDLRWLASDFTVCGGEEPTAYVTEIFQGDGVTASFLFSQRPFAPAAKQKTSIVDFFQGTSLNARVWTTIDPGGHTALTASGLTCMGGTGREAEASIASLQEIELGGAVTIEGDGIQIASGSAGTLLGLYTGSVNAANCFAGFEVSSPAGVATVSPMINGATAGSTFKPEAGHIYTFRLRVFSPEMERVRQSYFYLKGTSSSSYGGQVVVSSGQVEFEVQDVTSGTPGAPLILFSGLINAIPPSCVLGLLDSGSLVCSMKSVQCTQSGPLWIALSTPGSTPAVQFLGTSAEGGSCRVTTSGTLEFYPANIPSAGSLIYASYRLKGRAVARRASPPVEGGSAKPSTRMWIGTVGSPAAWSSVDCDNAAAALLGTASSAAAALRGTYKSSNLRQQVDIWPGDALLVGPMANGTSVSVIVREVQMELLAGSADTLFYTVKFANDWAESLSIKLSSTIPADAVIPQQETAIASALESLSGLVVASATGTGIVLSTNVEAPVNGGFEVRRRDNTFGPGIDSDLVLRTSTSSIGIPRSAAVEQYYIRMYDGANPPHYSLFSAAVFVNLPL